MKIKDLRAADPEARLVLEREDGSVASLKIKRMPYGGAVVLTVVESEE